MNLKSLIILFVFLTTSFVKDIKFQSKKGCISNQRLIELSEDSISIYAAVLLYNKNEILSVQPFVKTLSNERGLPYSFSGSQPINFLFAQKKISDEDGLNLISNFGFQLGKGVFSTTYWMTRFFNTDKSETKFPEFLSVKIIEIKFSRDGKNKRLNSIATIPGGNSIRISGSGIPIYVGILKYKDENILDADPYNSQKYSSVFEINLNHVKIAQFPKDFITVKETLELISDYDFKLEKENLIRGMTTKNNRYAMFDPSANKYPTYLDYSIDSLLIQLSR